MQLWSKGRSYITWLKFKPFTIQCHPVTLKGFSIQVLVNCEIFKLSLNLSFTHLMAQIACYELKRDLRSVMLKEIFHDSLKISKFTRISMENHSSMTGWQKIFFLIQILLIFGGRCNRYFWDIRLKIDRLPNFNMLFQLVLTNFSKANCFRFNRKLITWSTNAKGLLLQRRWRHEKEEATSWY